MNKSLLAPKIRAHGGFLREFYQQPLLIVALLAAFGGGCRKDGDTVPPSVTILLPGAGSSVQVPGFIIVRAEVRDDNLVKDVVVTLTDGNGAGLAPAVNRSVDAVSATIEVALEVTSEKILSTAATITVRATDGNNDGKDYRAITVIEAPLRRRALFAVNAPSGGPVTIHRADSAGNVELFATLTQDFSSAAISSYVDRLMIAGDVSGPLVAYDALTAQSLWAEPNTNSGTATWFQAIHLGADRRLYVAERSGAITALWPFDGAHQLTTYCTSGWTAWCIGQSGDRMIIEEREVGTSQEQLAIRSVFTGALLDAQALDFRPIAIVPYGEDRVLLIGNDASGGRVQERNIVTGLAVEVTAFPGEAISRVACDAAADLWLVLPTQIVRIDAATSLIAPFSATNAADLAHDAANGLVWIASGSDAIALDQTSGATLGTISFPLPVDRLLPFFNR